MESYRLNQPKLIYAAGQTGTDSCGVRLRKPVVTNSRDNRIFNEFSSAIYTIPADAINTVNEFQPPKLLVTSR